VSVNPENTNVIMGKEIYLLWGEATISDTMRLRDVTNGFAIVKGTEVTFEISPLSFYQVNPAQVEKLYSIAIDYANLKGTEEVWDLCCGIGTISLCTAKYMEIKLAMSNKSSDIRRGIVHGIEIVPPAIEDAKINAGNNHIENVDFICAAAEEYLPEHKSEISADVIIMDPPRKGMEKEALEVVVGASPSRIVYVSCDPATLSRDLKYLCENGYELSRVRPVDMFMHSVHVETVVLLSQLRHKPDDYIDVDVDVAELEGTSAETKATYEKIKKYVAEHNDGMKVSNLYIAQVKRKCGLELAENFNLPKLEDSRQPQCPKDKERAIMEALKTFQMI